MKTEAQLSAVSALKLAFIATVIATVPEMAFATDLGLILCNAYNNLSGPVLKGVATIAIMALGVGALFGKVSWSLATLVGVGIGAIYGAGAISTSISGYGC
ncbi:MAG: hypothetical protein EBV03_07635 [Proteobacteria bacterium]|nr:hypothetical protein [Pseudomonadota bacterium]